MEGLNTDSVWKDAEKLVEFVWFSLCLHFARRGREGWRELTKQSFEIKTDDTAARYDLALCIDNDDNQMTFARHIVYLCPSQQMMLLGPQINYMPSKSHVNALFTTS